MKKAIFLIVFISLFQTSNAQNHEFGVFLGGSNLIGDVGRTTYLQPRHLGYGLLYKWNKNPRYSWRFSLLQSKIGGNDYASPNKGRRDRGYFVENNVVEASAGFEFNFTDFNLGERGFVGTPYLATGISYFTSDDYYVVNKRFLSSGNTGSFAIPIIAGYKVKVNDNFVLGLEIGPRYTFSDDIDGSNPKKDNLKYLAFGNTTSNDWYVFSGLTLTYTFGQEPCYCDNE
jgi:hypothetical protein